MSGRIVGMGFNQRYYLDGAEVTKEDFLKEFPDRPLNGGTIGTETNWTKPVISDGGWSEIGRT